MTHGLSQAEMERNVSKHRAIGQTHIAAIRTLVDAGVDLESALRAVLLGSWSLHPNEGA